MPNSSLDFLQGFDVESAVGKWGHAVELLQPASPGHAQRELFERLDQLEQRNRRLQSLLNIALDKLPPSTDSDDADAVLTAMSEMLRSDSEKINTCAAIALQTVLQTSGRQSALQAGGA